MALLTIVYVLLAIRSDVNSASVPSALLLGASGIFLVEFLVRLWDAPSRWVYVRGHWVDVLACIPLAGRLSDSRFSIQIPLSRDTPFTQRPHLSRPVVSSGR